jgi:hypothetical protein
MPADDLGRSVLLVWCEVQVVEHSPEHLRDRVTGRSVFQSDLTHCSLKPPRPGGQLRNRSFCQAARPSPP